MMIDNEKICLPFGFGFDGGSFILFAECLYE